MSHRESLCGKCRATRPTTDDSWCQLCRALQRIEALARTRGITPGHRALAEETLLQAGRQIEGIFNLDKQTRGYIESLNQRLTAAAKKSKTVTPEEVRESLSAKAAASKPPLTRSAGATEEKKEVESPSSEEESISVEPPAKDSAEDKTGVKAEASSPCVAPREPAGPPPQKKEEKREEKAERRRSRSRDRGRRGGVRHQQKFRALENPQKQFHQKLSWEPIPLNREKDRSRRAR